MSADHDNYWQAVQDTLRKTSSPNWLTLTPKKIGMKYLHSLGP